MSDPRTGPGVETERSMNSPAMRRILFSSFMGSVIEFYDFLLYALAAGLVFPQVFFAELTPTQASVAGLATLAIGYLARPVGGLILGRLGDTVGRKSVLILTMTAMGGASALIGLLPGQADIGLAAPLLLILLRIVQGLALGGEVGGAVLIAVEHAPGRRRGFAASFANLGGPAGSFLGATIMGLASRLPRAEFLAWGWRIPFLFSVVLIVVGLVVRLRVAESPLFRALQSEVAAKASPVADIFTRHWRSLLLGLTAGLAGFATQGIFSVWSVQRASALGVPSSTILTIKAWAPIGMFFVMAFSAWISDLVGRRTVLLVTCGLGVLAAFPLLLALDTGTTAGTAVAVIVGQAVFQGALFGPYTAFLSELFPTGVRYTGTSLAYQAAGTIGAGFTPAIAAALIGGFGSIVPIGVLYLVAFALTGAAVFRAREGRHVDLATVGAEPLGARPLSLPADAP